MHIKEAEGLIVKKLSEAEEQLLLAARDRITVKHSVTYLNDSFETLCEYRPEATVIVGDLTVIAEGDESNAPVYSIALNLNGEEIADDSSVTSELEAFTSEIARLAEALSESSDSVSVLSAEAAAVREEGERIANEMKASVRRIGIGGIIASSLIALLLLLLIIMSSLLK